MENNIAFLIVSLIAFAVSMTVLLKNNVNPFTSKLKVVEVIYENAGHTKKMTLQFGMIMVAVSTYTFYGSLAKIAIEYFS